jgi:signal transduction histidine kinase
MFSKSKYLSRVDLLFVFSLAIFTILIYQTFKSAQQVVKSRDLEEKTFEIMLDLDQLLSHVLDMENSTRDFIISGNEDFIAPFQTSKIALASTIDSLRLIIIDREQKLRLDTLNLLIKEKISIEEKMVSLARNREKNNALNSSAQNEANQLMDAIQVVINRAANKAQVLLSKRSAQTDEKRYARELYFIILSISALFVIIIAYALMRNNVKTLLQNKKIREDLIDELSYQNKQLEDFAHLTSHNLRGPANNIGALVSLVNENSPVSEFQLIFSKIEKVSKNLVETLNELLEMLHVKNNKDLKKIKMAFQQILEKEIENLEGEIMKTSAEIHSDFSASPSVEYPRAYLESIFHNLLSNALKYRSPDRAPHIQFKSEQKNGKIFLVVSDNGLGIDLDRFGDKLFGLRKTFHEHPDARGVGLFMTKAQIEAFGGKILVQSKVGVGTTFTVRF